MATNGEPALEPTALASTLNSVATFKWSMPQRFGLKRPDGIIDYHWNEGDRFYDKAYVNPTAWKVDFDACSDNSPGSTFLWEIDGLVVQNPNPSSCTFSHQFVTQGIHRVKVVRTASDGTQTIMEAPITIKDLLIVSLGDSVASGQGNPDLERRGSRAAKWVDKLCARSSIAGPAQAAFSIEQADRHTSVTFLSFACTGAGITAGLIGKQTIRRIELEPQIDELKKALNGRPIDALIISIGGNDLGFADLVARCIIRRNCHNDSTTVETFNRGLNDLASRYQALKDKIAELGPVKRVFITEYPDLVRDEDGELCDGEPNFDLLRGIRRSEAEWASDTVVPALNGKVKDAAQLHNWVYVSGIAERFKTHGYCADDPVRWVRTFRDAKRVQGADSKCDLASLLSPVRAIRECIISSGAVHPAKGGHAVYASRLIESLQNENVLSPPGP